MNPALRASAAHVFVESLDDPALGGLALSADDDHHLRRVLRLRPTQRITLSDGRGRWIEAELGEGHLLPAGDVHHTPEPRAVVVAAAVPKGDRVEWMVQKLTELGVTRVLLLDCERSVVRLHGEQASKQLGRLRRIAREASMQSRRVWLPEIAQVSFGEIADQAGVAIAEPGGGELPVNVDTILVGPEGGFSPNELVLDVPRVALADTILRVETAALVAAMMLNRSVVIDAA